MKKIYIPISVLIIMFFAISENLKSQSIVDNIGSDYMYSSQTDPPAPIMKYNSIDGLTNRIWLDENQSGAVPTDIFYQESTNRIYVYGKRNVLVIDASTNTLVAQIPISDYSQFYPVIEQTEYLNDNHFAYNPDNGILYCVNENFDIWAINTSTFVATNEKTVLDICGKLTYYNIFIKYDSRLQRIYLGYSSSLTPLSSELYIYDPYDNYITVGHLTFETNKLRGMEVNSSSNLLYLSRNDGFFSVDFDPTAYISNSNVNETLIGTLYGSNDIAGNLLYINQTDIGGIHKLFCFPNGGNNTNENYFVKDILTGNVSTQQCPSRVTSTVYNGTDKVFLSYKSDPGNTDLRTISSSNYSVIGNDVNTRASGISGNNYTIDMEVISDKLILTKDSEITLFNPTNSSVSQLKQGENNYFSRVTEFDNQAYVIGTWSTTHDVYDVNGQVGNSLQIGGIVYHACHNPAMNKIYFYNNHLQENSKVFILNTTNDIVSLVEFETSICDIEIDPNTNNAMVSTNDASDYIKIIDGNSDILLPQSQWLQLNHGNIGEMFVSKEKKLYSIIKEGGSNYNPGIEIWQLDNINGNSYVGFQSYTNTNGYPIKGYFTSDFQANKSSSYVFAVLSTPGYSSFGYVSKINDMQYSNTDLQVPGGSIDIEFCGKFVYIGIGGNAKTVIPIDIGTWIAEPALTMVGEISDMEANLDDGLVYVLHRQDAYLSMISKVVATDISSENIVDLHKEANTLNYNSDNTTLYVHVPFNYDGCSYSDGGIYEIFDENAGELGMVFYTNGNRNRDRYSHGSYAPLHHNMIIDQQTHKMYYGGGGYSCINYIDLVATYKIPLRFPYTWLSVPRHERPNSNDPTYTPTSTVFHQNNVSCGYDVLNLDWNYIYNSSGGYSSTEVSATWALQYQWQYDQNGDMDEIVSTKGYKLKLITSESNNEYLRLDGVIEDPTTTIELFCREENWIGYFIPEVQSVFDALGDNLNSMYLIQHQDFTCVRTPYPTMPCGTKATRDAEPGTWHCDDRPNIKYGDMIIVTPDKDIAAMDWNWSGNQPSNYDRPEVIYYEYEELADYTTFAIELDTLSDNPQELGAFVNDTCVGACSVLIEDTLVVMKAYLGDQPGDSVTFREHYNTKGATEHKINEYFVLNFNNQEREKRVVKTGETDNLFVVSFKKSTSQENDSFNEIIDYKLYPNPASNALFYSFNLLKDGLVSISIFDVNGKLVAMPINKKYYAGLITGKIELDNISVNKLKPGLYIVKTMIGNNVLVKKVIIE